MMVGPLKQDIRELGDRQREITNRIDSILNGDVQAKAAEGDVEIPDAGRVDELVAQAIVNDDPRIAVAVICATVTYALMNLVMTSTPLAVVGCGYTTANAADIVSAHVLAMYVPSFFTGHLIARFGTERIMALGLLI